MKIRYNGEYIASGAVIGIAAETGYDYFAVPSVYDSAPGRVAMMLIFFAAGMSSLTFIRSFTQVWQRRKDLKRAAEILDDPVLNNPTLPCPACGEPVALAELRAHLRREHSDPEHVSVPILALVRLPGATTWTPVRKEDG